MKTIEDYIIIRSIVTQGFFFFAVVFTLIISEIRERKCNNSLSSPYNNVQNNTKTDKQ